MPYVIKDADTGYYYARTSKPGSGWWNKSIDLAKMFATEQVARTTSNNSSRVRNYVWRRVEIVPVLLIDLSNVSETMRLLVDDVLLIKKLEGGFEHE
jgi:hypothetical protein